MFKSFLYVIRVYKKNRMLEEEYGGKCRIFFYFLTELYGKTTKVTNQWCFVEYSHFSVRVKSTEKSFYCFQDSIKRIFHKFDRIDDFFENKEG